MTILQAQKLPERVLRGHRLGAFVSVPENRTAISAVQRLLEGGAGLGAAELSPLLIHGPSGSGKSHLAQALAHEIAERRPTLKVNFLESWLSAASFEEQLDGNDLVVIEDIHKAFERPAAQRAAMRLVDHAQRRRQQLVLTSLFSPRRLPFLSHLSSRLSQGLVVQLGALSVASRIAVFKELLQRRSLSVPEPLLRWLRQRLPASGKELESAALKLEALARQRVDALDVHSLADYWQAPARHDREKMASLTEQVADYFQVPVRALRHQARNQRLLLPRQLGMYLSRQLTDLSFQEIAKFFGRNDHTTVLYACRKIEREVPRDPALANTVRELQSANS